MGQKNKTEIAVVGDGWPAIVTALTLAENGNPASLILTRPATERAIPLSAIYLGNGECRENARLIYGAALTDWYWNLTAANLKLAKSAFCEWGGSFSDAGVTWYASDEKQAERLRASATAETRFDSGRTYLGSRAFSGKLHEPGLIVETSSLLALALAKAREKGITIHRAKSASVKESPGLTPTTVHAECEEGIREIEASLLFVVSEWLPSRWFTSLADKCVPVTLSSFSSSLPAESENFSGLALFNSGSDFACRDANRTSFGSFRNLFEDKAAGLRESTDPVGQVNIRKYFGELGWVGSEFSPSLSLEMITCDGLPIIGPLAHAPNVFVASGFAGRGASFAFEVARRLKLAVIDGKADVGLNVCSAKRFV